MRPSRIVCIVGLGSALFACGKDLAEGALPSVDDAGTGSGNGFADASDDSAADAPIETGDEHVDVDSGIIDVVIEDAAPDVQFDSALDVDASCPKKVVLNEVQADSVAGAEFIELYNPSDCAVGLVGWKLSYRSSANNLGPPLYVFPGGTVIGGKTRSVIGNQAFGNTATVDFTMTGGLGNSGGQVGLLDADGNLVDGVGYGTVVPGDYVETTPAPIPPAGQSIARKPDGHDTNNNSLDWQIATTPTPGAAN